MPTFPFPMSQLINYGVAAKLRAPLLLASSFLSDLGINSYSVNNITPFEGVGRPGVRWYPKDFCFIRVKNGKAKNTDSVIAFQFMPKTIADIKSAIYQDIQIIGRSSPFKSYSSSSSRTISFTLDFYASPEDGGEGPSPQIIKQWITELQALLHPIYEDYSVSPPPRCIVHIGNQVNMLGICKNVSVNYNSQRVPWTSFNREDGFYIFGASVSLTFEEVKEIPVGYYEKVAGGDEESPYKIKATEEFVGPPLPDSGVGGSIGVNGPGGDQGFGAVPAGYQG